MIISIRGKIIVIPVVIILLFLCIFIIFKYIEKTNLQKKELLEEKIKLEKENVISEIKGKGKLLIKIYWSGKVETARPTLYVNDKYIDKIYTDNKFIERIKDSFLNVLFNDYNIIPVFIVHTIYSDPNKNIPSEEDNLINDNKSFLQIQLHSYIKDARYDVIGHGTKNIGFIDNYFPISSEVSVRMSFHNDVFFDLIHSFDAHDYGINLEENDFEVYYRKNKYETRRDLTTNDNYDDLAQLYTEVALKGIEPRITDIKKYIEQLGF